MGDAVTDRRTSRPTTASELLGLDPPESDAETPPAARAAPPTGQPAVSSVPSGPELRLEDLVLFDTEGNDPVVIDAVVFTDEGIGVVRTAGSEPRILPWSAVATHVVERWSGGIVPGWWVAPQPRPEDVLSPAGAVPATATERHLPEVGPGAVIAIQTPFGTYRFLRPGADPIELSNRITDFAVRHHGLSGVPSVTMVARPVRGNDRRQGTRARPAVSPWARAKPFLVVALVVFLVTAVTLILLQSAGVVHLPYLGGSGSGLVPPVRIR